MKKLNFKSLLSVFALSFCCTAVYAESEFISEDELFGDDEFVNTVTVYDPLESVNRHIFNFNDFIYTKALDPAVGAYQWITPDPVEKGASNFFQNLKYPVRLAGNLLQGRLKGAWVETGRFAINSTVGILGINTPADRYAGFERIPAEDIGQVLGAWGVGEGPYLVLPLLGPSNVRDLFGAVGDRAVNPLTEPFNVLDEWEWRAVYGAGDFISSSPSILDRYFQLKGNAIDPYGSMKNGYTQFRQGEIKE